MSNRPIYRYQPINLFPDRTIGIKLPFNRAAAGRTNTSAYDSSASNGGTLFNMSKTTEEQSTSNLINLVMTEVGERYMQPEFGTTLRHTLFEQNTEDLVSAVDDSLRSAIERWVPYIELVDLDISRNIDRHIFSVKIIYRVTNFPAERVINVLLSENTIQVIPINNNDITPLVLTQVGSF
jgi:phage baseplate assembly protein W